MSIKVARSWEQFLWEWNDGALIMFAAWLLWMLVGTLFYARVDFEGSYCKGFYYSMNVGYSIGWGVLHERTAGSKLFSVGYLLVGAIFVSRWLAYLLDHALQNTENSYDELQLRRKLREGLTLRGWAADVYVFFVSNTSRLFVIYLWGVYILFGTFWSVGVIGWTWVEGLYFAMSSLSTGGLQGIPADSADWIFLVVGLFAASGVPLMGMAVANIAQFMIQARRMARLESLQSLEISADDYELLQVISADSGKTALSKGDFVLLCLAQQGALEWEQLKAVLQRFEDLDPAERGSVAFRVQPREAHERDVFNPLQLLRSPDRGTSDALAIRDIARDCLPSPSSSTRSPCTPLR